MAVIEGSMRGHPASPASPCSPFKAARDQELERLNAFRPRLISSRRGVSFLFRKEDEWHTEVQRVVTKLLSSSHQLTVEAKPELGE